ncbi:MAG: hypothetical protein HZA93_24830 [Verrucomicrobia bacterium]|nr:hypothetical protein [Verrucomicrobiota bacterium]
MHAKLDAGELDPAHFNFAKPSCSVILSLREDFLPDLEGLKQAMPALVHNRLRLKKLSGTQALEIVTKPAPHLLADGVAEKIVEFVAGARGGSAERLAELDVEPPLLSVICRELNDRRRALSQGKITADLVSGNRREILTDFYERSVADLPEAMRTFVEDHLLTKSGFRDNLALETALEFPGVTRPLIDTLVARRLLRLEDRLGVQRVELTHDVLAEVIRGSRDSRQQRQVLEQTRERERRSRRRHRTVIAGMAAVIFALCVGGLVGLRARRIAMQESSRTDATFANQLLVQGNLSDGIAYLVRAARKDPHNHLLGPRLMSLLAMHNYALSEGERMRLPSIAINLNFSDDGRRLVALTEDGTLAVCDLATTTTATVKLASPPSNRVLPTMSGALMAILCQDGAVRIVDSARAQLVREIPFEKRVSGMGFFGDRLLVRLQDRSLKRIAVVSGKTAELPTSEGGFYSAAISSTGRWGVRRQSLAREFECWDLSTNERVAKFGFEGNAAVLGLVGREDAPIVVTVADLGAGRIAIRLWSFKEGRLLSPATEIPGVASTSIRLDASRDQRYFTVLTSGGLRLFDAAAHAPVGALIPGVTPGATVSFTPDGQRFLVHLLSGQMQFFDTATATPVFSPIDPGGTLRPFAQPIQFDQSSRLMLTNNSEGAARIWDLTNGQLLAELPRDDRGRTHAALAGDGNRIATCSVDGRVALWSIARTAITPQVVRFISTPDDQALNFVPGRPARLLHLASGRATVRDVVSGREVGNFSPPEPYVLMQRARSYREDMRVMIAAAAGDDAPQRRWQAWWLDPAAGVTKRVDLQGAPPVARPVFFSPKRDLAAVAYLGERTTVRVWNLQTGEMAMAPIEFEGSVSASSYARFLVFNPDGGRLAAGDALGVVRIWNITDGKLLRTLPALRESIIQTLAFDPTGARLAVANNWGETEVWNLISGTKVGVVRALGGSVNSLEFSPDGRWVLTGSGDGTAQVWDVASGAPIGERIRHRTQLRSARFSADGRRILTASNDFTARVWDARTGLPLSEPYQHENRVFNGFFSPDGRYFFTESNSSRFGGNQASGWVWPTPPEAGDAPVPDWLLDLATHCAGRVLTDTGHFAAFGPSVPQLGELRSAVAALPDDAPYAEWGRWLLADRATRPIAPGFTITPPRPRNSPLR